MGRDYKINALGGVVLGVGSVLLVGCGGASAPRPPAPPCALPVQVAWVASDRLNPDESGAALPTLVRVHQLKTVAHLDELEFEDLWRRPAEALGADQVGMQEGTVFPGQTLVQDVELDPATRFLVGVAVVRRPTGSLYRSVVVLPTASERCDRFESRGAPRPAVQFRVDEYRVTGSSRLGGSADDVDLPEDVRSSGGTSDAVRTTRR